MINTIRRIAASLLLLSFWLSDASADSISLGGLWTLDGWKQGPAAVRGPLEYSRLPRADILSLEARVPGEAGLALLDAGLIPDPTIDSNIAVLEDWEGYQWRYSRSFPSPVFAGDEIVVLRFGGIDCFADVWLNGVKLGETDNMLIEWEFEVSGLLAPGGGKNRLEVYLRSAVEEGRKYFPSSLSRNSPKPESIRVRRAPHTYGWDIMPRLVSAGLWRDVSLEVRNAVHIADAHWYTESAPADGEDATVYLDYTLKLPIGYGRGGLFLDYDISLPGSESGRGSVQVASHAGRVRIPVPKAKLWWPRGMGESVLYDATLTLRDASGKVFDSKSSRIGIRKVDLVRTETHSPDSPGQFLFTVNGEPVFIKGSNWTPLDAFHSRDPEHLQEVLAMAEDLGCNMLRCWGGNVYEDHPFYDFCDAHGILVWQDFSMGCTQYPQDQAFQDAIFREVQAVVRKLRNHPSIILWAGNNEDDVSTRWSMKSFDADPNRDIVSRVTIPAALFECDPTRPYLPSSPYYSPEVVAAGFDPHLLPEDHLWGPRGYYKDDYYTGSTCLFASETGYHGMPCRESLEAMFSPENVYPWSDDAFTWKDPWLTKSVRPSATEGYVPKRNNLMINQQRLIFGEVPTDLDRFIAASQIVQGEAVKYFIERFRSTKFAPRTGILWWNIRDGWPIISDAVVDWYGRRKTAYGYIKNAQRDVCVMISDAESYARAVGDPATKGHPLVAVNDTRRDVTVGIRVIDAASGKTVYQGSCVIPANGRKMVKALPVPKGQGMWIIDYETGGETFRNHYLYGSIPFDLDEYLTLAKNYNIINR